MIPATSAHLLADYYRCPEDLVEFVVAGRLSAEQGYFRFGDNAVCYGRSGNGTRQDRVGETLYDVLADTQVEEGRVDLRFDPSEVVDNLRLERYPHHGLSGRDRLLKKIYYWLRPLTTRSMRRWIQRFHARKWRDIGFPAWPVDTSVDNICERLMLLATEAAGENGVPFVWFWPNGNRGCVLMTHDVEGREGRDFCHELLDIDEAFGIKASFQIVPEQRYTVPPELVASIRGRGFEIAIQDLNHDGRIFDNREEFLRRIARVHRYAAEYGAKGFRAAVLYRNPDWYSSLQFSFDMSMPNVARLDPQRGGCCTVMPYFIGDILELPVTTTQDYTLFHILNERSIDLWKLQTQTILQKNGLVSFIVHPDYITEHDTRAVYESLLGYLKDLSRSVPLWFALPSEIDSWWRARSQMSVVKEGDAWRIVGKGSERAALAFARKSEGKLVYELTQAAAVA